MKRILVFILTVCCITFCVPISAFAETFSEENANTNEISETTIGDSAISFSCIYDASSGTINLSGNVNHDIMVMHSNYTMEMYAVPLGYDNEKIIDSPEYLPLATSIISIKFQFSVAVKTTMDKYSRYSLALRSPDGEVLLHTNAKYPEIPSGVSFEHDAGMYKGIESGLTSSVGNAGAGTVLEEVDFNRLIGKGAGTYRYQSGSSPVYFDQTYVHMLDTRIRTFSSAGTKVYLRILLPDEIFLSSDIAQPQNEKKFSLYSEEGLNLIDSAIMFLSERYNSYCDGSIAGYVVGKEADKPLNSQMTLGKYAEIYSLYVIVVARAARLKNPSLEILIPFSHWNTYGEGNMVKVPDGYSPSELLEKILEVCDRTLGGEFELGTIIESSSVPFGLERLEADQKIDLNADPGMEFLHADNLTVYQSYLEALQMQYRFAPKYFLYVWHPPKDLVGNALSCAYAYSYYKLVGFEKLASFVVSFSDSEKEGIYDRFEDICHLFSEIDTSLSFEISASLLPFFGVDSWSEIILGVGDANTYAYRNVLKIKDMKRVPDSVIGYFPYFDFSSSVNSETWFGGVFCQGLKIDYTSRGERALKIDFLPPEHNREYAEALCLYEYPENLVYTPFLCFTVELEKAEGEDISTLYEFRVQSGNGKHELVATTAIQCGEKVKLVLNLSEYSRTDWNNYWKLSIRPLNGDASKTTFWLYSVIGYSSEYTNDTLKSLIEEERMRIRNQATENDNDTSAWEKHGIALTIGVVILIIGAGLFIALKPRDSAEDGNPPDTQG